MRWVGLIQIELGRYNPLTIRGMSHQVSLWIHPVASEVWETSQRWAITRPPGVDHDTFGGWEHRELSKTWPYFLTYSSLFWQLMGFLPATPTDTSQIRIDKVKGGGNLWKSSVVYLASWSWNKKTHFSKNDPIKVWIFQHHGAYGHEYECSELPITIIVVYPAYPYIPFNMCFPYIPVSYSHHMGLLLVTKSTLQMLR